MSSAAEKLDLADVAARLSAAGAPRARERRRFRRMPIVVAGRMLDPRGAEHDCRTADISPGDVRLASSVLPQVDDRVVLYLEGFGRLAGRVARRCGEGEVAIIFETSNHKREKMAEALIWNVNKETLGLNDLDRRLEGDAQAPRSNARVHLETGDIIEGEVLDFSLAGITLRTPKPPPPIGAWVRVGTVYGRVARRIDCGFAIDFDPLGAANFTLSEITKD